MALIKCYECNHEISSEAESCPNCGAPKPQKHSIAEGGNGCITLPFSILAIIIGILGFTFIIWRVLIGFWG
jgi:hypothetical protein